jgi:hypothetical protein
MANIFSVKRVRLACRCALLVVALTACQRGATDGGWKRSALGRDLDRICHVMAYSGADKEGPENHAYLTAQWLGQNLESSEGRAFLVDIAPKQPAAKAQLLQSQALAVGVADCPTVAMWQVPGAENN